MKAKTSKKGIGLSMPLKRLDTLTDRVRSALSTALIAGAFSPGDLLKIRDVADALQVSLTPAREALSMLIAEGVLLEGPNKTALVPPITRESLREITDLRVSLECLAAAAAVDNISPAAVAKVAEHHQILLRATQDSDVNAILEANANFHFGIYRHSHKPLLLKMIETVWLRSSSYLRIAYPAFGNARKGLINHEAIIKGLRRRDKAAVEAAIRKDIITSSEYLFETLSTHFSEPGQASLMRGRF